MYDQAIMEISYIKNSLELAEDELKKTISAPPEAISMTWLIVLTGSLLGLISIGMIYFFVRTSKIFEDIEKFRPMPVDRMTQTEKKIMNALTLIELQYKRGLLSKENYEKLKILNQKKLSELKTRSNMLEEFNKLKRSKLKVTPTLFKNNTKNLFTKLKVFWVGKFRTLSKS